MRKGMGPTLRLLNSFDIHSILYQFFSFLFLSVFPEVPDALQGSVSSQLFLISLPRCYYRQQR